MSKEIKEDDSKKVSETKSDWSCDNIWILLFFLIFGNSDSPKISELEKKVARLEGQMSMIGGKNL